MSLSENDVAGIRGEPYFLVPVTARNENPRFWGWPGKYRPSAAGGFPERRFKALIQKDGVQVTEDCRLYYFRDRDEFRFKSAEVYTMGKSKAGSFLEISWRKTDQFETAKLVLTEKKHRRFGTLAKLAFKFVIGGKKWCYQ